MVIFKTDEQIQIMREGGKILASILVDVSKKAIAGASTKDLNDYVNDLCKKHDVIPVFLNYTPYGAPRPYPASICISLNDEIVHGIPNESPRILKDGDVVALDMGIKYKGLIVDSATTVIVGEGDTKAKKLLEITERALYAGIDAAKVGKRTGDIGFAIENTAKPYGFGIPEELGGHGVGENVHEDPFVPNFGKPRQGVLIKNGMVFAIEPMLNEGTKRIVLCRDGYTYKTADGKRSAHFEHTVAIVNGQAEILTKL
ncbi:MAG: type I methionyl aminopeptidase [Candidatus Paceibacterota bacterium]|jgi:methionyl aminopeptidase